MIGIHHRPRWSSRVADRNEVPPAGLIEDVTVDRHLGRALRIAWIVLLVQLIGMLLWSALLYSRWGVTWDYALRFQAWWGIAHGNLDPYVTAAQRFYWQDHFELINWPLAPLSRIWPGGLWPMWIQDLTVFGGEIGAVLLVADAVRRPKWPRQLPGFMAVGLVVALLVLNPWIYGSISFDFHYQSVSAACFAMLACREMVRGSNKRMGLWVGLCLLTGDIAGTFLVALGASGVLLGKDTRRRGAVVGIIGLVWFLGVSALGGGKGSGLSGHYAYLATSGKALGPTGLITGMLEHPNKVLQQMWGARLNLWAYVVSSGFLGLFSPLALLPILVLFEGGSGQGGSLSAIAYENFGAMLFLAPLSAIVLGRIIGLLAPWLAKHARRVRLSAAGLARVAVVALIANAVVWTAVWVPQLPGQWLTTTPAGASTLDRISQLIPQSAEVVASQGVLGRFCGRQFCYAIFGRGASTVELKTRSDYFVITPYQGVETADVQTQLSMIGQLAAASNAHLVLAQNGVWAFRLDRAPGQTAVHFGNVATEPAWAARSAIGQPQLHGPPSHWSMSLTGTRSGYVMYGAYWNLFPGPYVTTVTLSNTTDTLVEVWDATTSTLITRRMVSPSSGFNVVHSQFSVTKEDQQHIFSGWGPFAFKPQAPPSPADSIEIRVWSAGKGDVNVYSVGMVSINKQKIV